MAWPQGTPNWLKNQWGVISGQVSARATTAELVDALRPYAQASPEGWGPRGVIILSQLRAQAVSMRSAADQVTKTGLSGTIDQSMITEAPWARSPVQQQLVPQFLVRAQVSYPNPEALAGVLGAEAELTDWISAKTSTLPGTLDELVERITQKTRETGTPPVPITGVTRIEILRE